VCSQNAIDAIDAKCAAKQKRLRNTGFGQKLVISQKDWKNVN